MKLENIEKLVINQRSGDCPCGVITRLIKQGLENVTVEEIDTFLNVLKRSNYHFSGDTSKICNQALFNFFSGLMRKKGVEFFEELKYKHKLEVDRIINCRSCLE